MLVNNKKIMVTKRFEFDYAHKLPNYDGNCANLHGHRGVAEFTFKNAPTNLKKDGMVIDFKDVKKIIGPIIKILDHTYLNDLIENPTAENICLWLFEQIENTDLYFHLVKIRVYETPDSWADLYCEKI
jgi:6-pyruvoyltetrahydropterin/6-carboxytetrahydropterin synthase